MALKDYLLDHKYNVLSCVLLWRMRTTIHFSASWMGIAQSRRKILQKPMRSPKDLLLRTSELNRFNFERFCKILKLIPPKSLSLSQIHFSINISLPIENSPHINQRSVLLKSGPCLTLQCAIYFTGAK